MKKILMFALLLCIKQLNAQTTITGGYVYGTWTLAGSPYLIQSSVEVPNDSTLTIEPGVTVNFQGHYKIIVLGRLLALGTQTDSIFFTTSNTATGWYGIRFDGTTSNNDTSKIYYCNLQWGKAGGSGNDLYGGALMFANFSKAIVSNCLLKNNLSYVLYCTNSSPVISNNKFYGNPVGGMYLLNLSKPNIFGNTVSYNNGAGIWGADTVNIHNNIISHNAGVGILVGHGGKVLNNTISYNTSAYWAGGIYTDENSTTLISNNTISYNICTGGGYAGGVCCYICNATISDNVIANNSAADGAGIFSIGPSISTPTISNNVIVNNSTTGPSGGGGGISWSNSPVIINNTIANNSAATGGGLIGGTSVYNCIIYGNTATQSGDQVYIANQTGQPNFYYCNIQGGSAAFGMNGNFYSATYQNNIDVSPLFLSPSGGSGTGFNGVAANWALQSTSTCIDAGNPSGTYPATDIAGNPRVYNSIIDMGAYEFQGMGDGINKISENNSVTIYPNPAQNNFTIATNSSTKQTLQVFDVNGKLILTQTINSTTNIDASTLAQGVYNVSITNSEGAINKKLVIIK